MSTKQKKPKGWPEFFNTSRPDQPRWTPSPKLRGLGFKDHQLKRPNGDYMTEGEGYDAAKAINAMVADFLDGLSIKDSPWKHLAPAQNDEPRPAAGSPRSIGVLIDRFIGTRLDRKTWSPPAEYFDDKSPATLKDYRTRLKRLVEVIAGEVEGDPAKLDLPPSVMIERCARYEAAISETRAQDISELLTDDRPLQAVYKTLSKLIDPETGRPYTHNANSVMTYTSGWLSWVLDQTINGKAIIPFNPALTVKRTASPGRKNPWPLEVQDVFDATAMAKGWVSVARARQMATYLGWEQKDILGLQLKQFARLWAKDTTGELRERLYAIGRRSKTAVDMATGVCTLAERLLNDIIADRKKALGPNIELSPETYLFLVDDIPGRYDAGAVGKPWSSSYFQHTVIEVKKVAGITGYTFQDLRDTAYTDSTAAGMNQEHIQSRMQHSSVEGSARLGAKHYGLVTPEVGAEAARLLDELHKRRGQL